MATVNSTLHAALADGAVVVTPNRRLARVLHREFDLAQRAAGHSAWRTPTILPYSIWLATLWDAALPSDAGPGATALLLTAPQAAQLWRAVVEAEGMPLLDPRGAAALAAEAWTLVHEWGAGGESWRAWRRSDDVSDDAAVFAQWAEAYRAQLQGIGAVDLAQLPNALTADATRVAVRCGATVLAGFSELAPQQERLCAALLAAGVPLRQLDSLPERSGMVIRTVAASPSDELAAALDWARVRVQQNPHARIGIVIEDLAARRDEVAALATERLCPGALIPGTVTAPAPFEISLGIALASVPLVVAALDLISLAEAALAAGAAAALLRSPYLPAAEQAWAARARIERTWLEGGQREVTLAEAIAALESCSPALAARWRDGRDPRRTTHASPRQWVDRWRSWLLAAGWPGTRSLDSDEYQAREAWERILGQFASLAAVSRRLGAASAIDALRALVGQTIFQPEGSAAPIQILGLLEGTGLTFDALWVTGLAAERWPPAPAPNPLLPMGWQRERQVPRASAERELAFATLLTARFARAAPEVVLSSPASADDDQALSPSALILGYPESAPTIPAATWLQALAHSARLEVVDDDRAPPLAEGKVVPGGSRIVASQSDCPFQAVARHRLRAQPWPLQGLGLGPPERGLLVHAALAAFWEAVRDHATLGALSAAARAAQIEAAVEAAIAALPAPRWRTVPPAVRAGEARRLAALLDAWLSLERERTPFVVRGVEVEQTLQLAGLTFRMRLDRVDTLLPQGIAVLDYKTGSIERPTQWFEQRPRASQLGLYTLAQRAAHPELAVRAVAYVQLRAGAVAAAGLAADPSAWPGLTSVADAGPVRDWQELEAWWRAHLGTLAAEIARGHAAVAPRESPLPCRNCGLYAVCRIQSVRHLQDSDVDADDA
jgi:ATP-dependent helicase/nuclease subunit B